MKIGAHMSTAGGASTAIDRALEIGAEAIQIFASSPRGWAFRPISEQEARSFRERSVDSGVGPAFIHGSYLVNIGSESLHQKSVDSLSKNLRAASQIGAVGVIFHGGSHKGAGFDAVFDLAVTTIKKALDNSPEDSWLILENSAGMGAHIGSSFAEMGRIIRAVESSRMKACLDTQHTFAAGYAITDAKKIDEALDEFDREIGLSNLAAVHANDSKVEYGSGVDRHENIGDGHIGLEGFEVIMAHPAFQNVPFLLEVPGIEGEGPDKENVNRLKAIRARLGTG